MNNMLTASVSTLSNPCGRCHWHQFRGVRSPKGDFSAFNAFDQAQSEALQPGAKLDPLGILATITHTELSLESEFEHQGTRLLVKGRLDHLAVNSNEIILIDRKTGSGVTKDGEVKPNPAAFAQLALYKKLLTVPGRVRFTPELRETYPHLPSSGPLHISAACLLYMSPLGAKLHTLQTVHQECLVTLWTGRPQWVSLTELPDPAQLVARYIEAITSEKAPPRDANCPNCAYAVALGRLMPRRQAPTKPDTPDPET